MEREGLEEVRVQKIGILFFAIFSLVFGLFLGLILGLSLMVTSFLIPSNLFGFDISSYLVWGYYSLIIFPIAFGILGFIFGAIGIFLYNLVAKITKGVELYS